jgi:hypothetical protein
LLLDDVSSSSQLHHATAFWTLHLIVLKSSQGFLAVTVVVDRATQDPLGPCFHTVKWPWPSIVMPPTHEGEKTNPLIDIQKASSFRPRRDIQHYSTTNNSDEKAFGWRASSNLARKIERAPRCS